MSTKSDASVITRARSQAVFSTFDASVFRSGLCSRFPMTTTASTIVGKSSTSGVYRPPRADQRDSQSARESAVQNDHRMQITQKVAKVLSVTSAKLRHVRVALRRLRVRPYFSS